MKPKPPVKLSVLRNIGFDLWDPIGLLPEGEKWDHKPFANEYDGYILHVVHHLRDGWSLEQAASYLKDAEVTHIGLSPSTETPVRARRTAEALQQYVHELDRPVA